jgi:hypothetical protein
MTEIKNVYFKNLCNFVLYYFLFKVVMIPFFWIKWFIELIPKESNCSEGRPPHRWEYSNIAIKQVFDIGTRSEEYFNRYRGLRPGLSEALERRTTLFEGARFSLTKAPQTAQTILVNKIVSTRLKSRLRRVKGAAHRRRLLRSTVGPRRCPVTV